MSLPNSVLKIISKNGEVVDFAIERIIRSIRKTMEDVRGSSRWSHDLRARKCSEKVAARVYREFYHLAWLKSDFVVKFLNYAPAERIGRLKSAKITERVVFAIHETFRDTIPPKAKVAEHRETLEAFVRNEIDSTKVDPNLTEGLFPKMNAEELDQIVAFLVEETIAFAAKETPTELLYPSREYVQDMIEKELKDIGEVDVAEAYMIFREGRRKIHAGEISPMQFTNNGIHRELVSRTLKWNIEHECETVFALNEWIQSRNGKRLEDLIEAGERRYIEDVRATARNILERKDDIKVVIIAGPSSSNKTTTTVIIGQELKKIGLKLKQLNVDNYFFDLTKQPKDEFGDYDFEMPEAIDMELLNQNLEGLLEGRTVQMPYYDFKLGKRSKYTDFHVASDEVILIDCLHGLYRTLTASVPNRNKFKIYIESMNVLRDINGEYTKWTDVRLLKRMIRDSQHRGYDPKYTLAHWPYVRKGELKHIVPYIFSTDAVLNSGLPYELPILKVALSGLYPTNEWIEKLLAEGRLDPYIRGKRVSALLDTIVAFPDLEQLPSTSPIREFTGGSSYEIPHN
jgi:uridine kinase